ncbi:hypothetical protein [Ferviditalea candida]|uniref:Sporulation membrane protein YtrI C-terminal domain-containing protein n=1 Tax=Ferviditalea candida TaxID=3108399 RepID=A0ABU5ZDG8_9BACL|nr:hypothetical protein [Paenibacillaceae bacterium T2]
MRVPDFRLLARWLQALGLFISGMIVGAAVFAAIFHHNFNDIVIMYNSLREENRDLQDQVNDLNKFKKAGSVIKSIAVYIEEDQPKEPLDDITKQEIKNRVQRDLSILKGQSIDRLPRQLQIIRRVIDNKIYPLIQEKDYTIRIRTILVRYSELQAWIEVREFHRENPKLQRD